VAAEYSEAYYGPIRFPREAVVSTALAVAVVDEVEDRNTWSSGRSNTPAVVHCGLSHVADHAMGSEQKTAPWLKPTPDNQRAT
jgi:hypothetical protein